MAQDNTPIFFQFLPIRSLGTTWLGPHSAGALVLSEGQLAKTDFQAPTGYWQNLSFNCRTEVSSFLLAFSWRVLSDPRDCPQFLLTWLLCRLFPSMAACFLKIGKGVSFSSLLRQSYNAAMGVPPHHIL